MIMFKRAIHFGSMTGITDDHSQLFPKLCDLVVAAEQSGYDACFLADHLIQGPIGQGPENPILEANVLLGALAARTETIRLGSMVSPITTHNPAHFAKMMTTLDVISNGRAILGFGAGWDAEEADAYGIAFPPVPERMDRLDEGLAICKLMLTEDRPTFKGTYYEIKAPRNIPRPIGKVPILVGGNGEKRTLRIVAKYADACNIQGEPTEITRLSGVLRDHCAAVGRDPSEIQVTAAMPMNPSLDEFRAAVEARVAAGATGVCQLMAPDAKTIEARGRILQELLP
jgi:F420-dependent oxidoreductase-like protein